MTTVHRLLHRCRPVAGGAGQSDEEAGASVVEYALLLALIVIVCLIAVTLIGDQTRSSLSSGASALTSS